MADPVREHLLGVIFPNTPVTPEERRAFLKALRLQRSWEEEQGQTLPAGIVSFEIGHFRAQTDGKVRRGASGLCPAAYAVLLRAGLLYRGVER